MGCFGERERVHEERCIHCPMAAACAGDQPLGLSEGERASERGREEEFLRSDTLITCVLEPLVGLR
jgi:hypothetical protein